MDVLVALTAFAVILPAELPDKTFVATLVLSTRFRPVLVWVGVVLAFGVQTAVAVTAGGLLALLPERAVAAGTAVLFAIGSFVLLRSAARAVQASEDDERALTERVDRAATPATTRGAFAAIGTSFGVLFLAEWGDLSQLVTAGLAARYGEPISVFVGAWLALACVAAIGVLVGRTLLRVVRPSTVRRVAGALFAILAVLAALEALGVDLLV
ncbi:MAG: TMEM165/GDT1 family protein [Sporichthyaceae bacterium]|nr:TMEM165/GDT1 family protein [Sporichthyaceae bacterium]